MSVFNDHNKFNIIKFLIMKNLKNLGKALSNAEQKEVNGGRGENTPTLCSPDSPTVCTLPLQCVFQCNAWMCI